MIYSAIDKSVFKSVLLTSEQVPPLDNSVFLHLPVGVHTSKKDVNLYAMKVCWHFWRD